MKPAQDFLAFVGALAVSATAAVLLGVLAAALGASQFMQGCLFGATFITGMSMCRTIREGAAP